MTPTTDPLLATIAADNADIMPPLEQPVLVALSGGADSTAMLHLLLAMGYTCVAAHCNFGLRAAESDRDEHFVRHLCQQLGVDLHTCHPDVAAWQRQHGGSVEMACRELRYPWFSQLRKQLHCSCVAVAHHLDDQVETFFLNLLRGSGTRGLAGMAAMSGNHIWRPLLGISHAQLVQWLTQQGYTWVDDCTNLTDHHLRNRLRHHLLPLLDQLNPHARQLIARAMGNLRADHQLFTAATATWLPDPCHIATATLAASPAPATLLYHRLSPWGFNAQQCHEAIRAISSGSTGATWVTATHRLTLRNDHLQVTALPAPGQHPSTTAAVPVDLNGNGITTPVTITISRGDGKPFSPAMCDGKRVIALSNNVLQCRHVELRHWRRGDRIAPFGMAGRTRLVSDLFAERHLPPEQRRNAWLLVADDKILWVLGIRAAAHYTVKSNATDYLLLALK